jgi:ankyrin repeat protein
VNRASSDGYTALILACQNGHLPVVRLLLSRGANIHQAANDDGFTALIIACQNGHLPVVQLLLTRGADIHQAAKQGQTALMMACENGHLPVVQLLLSRGADIHQAANGGITSLAAACGQGRVSVVRLLLDTPGVNINVQSKRGITPLYNASGNGHTEVVDLLIRRGSIVDLANIFAITPLHAACSDGHEGAVRLLLAAGASATLEDDHGRSAMDFATEERHAGIRQILQQHMDAGAPCTQLIAVSDGSAGPSAQPQPQGAGAADHADQGPAAGRRRAWRFHCHKAECPNSEQSLQRRLLKCGKCRAVRYCSQECLNADWKTHKQRCRPPSLEEDTAASSSAPQPEPTDRSGGAGASGCVSEQAVEPFGPVGSDGAAAEGSLAASRPRHERRVCLWPGCSEPGLKTCSRCAVARYCGAAHQKLHWADHKGTCGLASIEVD